MTDTISISTLNLKALRPERVRSFLIGGEWIRDSNTSFDEADFFRLPGATGVEVVLPLNSEFGDYPDRLADLVHLVALVEHRPVWSVLNELSAPDGDIFRFRLSSPTSDSGVARLDTGIKIVTNSRKSIYSAACSVYRSQPVYKKEKYKSPDELLKRCMLGQTEVGSFIVTVIIPMPHSVVGREDPYLPFDAEEDLGNEPYSRQVSTTLIRGLNVLHQGARSQETKQITAGVASGVSANLCEAMAELKPPDAGSTLDIQVRWSGARRTIPVDYPRTLKFARPDFDVIRRAGRELRSQSEVTQGRIEGWVTDLHSKPSILEGYRGTIMLWRTDTAKGGKVRVRLGEVDYASACDAHRDGRKVQIFGKLSQDQSMKHPELSEYLSFHVL